MSPFFLLQIGDLAATAGFLAPLPPFFTTDNNPVTTTTTTSGTGGWGAGGLVGYKKKGERPSDTFVRNLSDLDPVVQEIGDVETNDQTDNVDEATQAPIEPLLTVTDAAARMRSRLEEQKRIAAELKARQLEDDDETFFMLT